MKARIRNDVRREAEVVVLETDAVRLLHMRDAASKAIEIGRGRSAEELSHDEIGTLALARLLEIVSEAAKNVSDETRERIPLIPWREIAEMPGRIIQGYFDLDLEAVSTILGDDLPPLVEALDRVLAH